MSEPSKRVPDMNRLAGNLPSRARPAPKAAVKPVPKPTARPGWNESFNATLGKASGPKAAPATMGSAGDYMPAPKTKATPKATPKPAAQKAKPTPKAKAAKRDGYSQDLKSFAAKERAGIAAQRAAAPKAKVAAKKPTDRRLANRGYDSYKKLMG